ncbi:MAG: hypothetical protein ACPGUC_10455, partial [Gammaproteobacteria bacterium]
LGDIVRQGAVHDSFRASLAACGSPIFALIPLGGIDGPNPLRLELTYGNNPGLCSNQKDKIQEPDAGIREITS